MKIAQCYDIVNVTKQEILVPAELGDNSRFIDIVNSKTNTLKTLARLLMLKKNGRGAWAGDRIDLVGEHTKPADFSWSKYAWQEKGFDHKQFERISQRQSIRNSLLKKEASKELKWLRENTEPIPSLETLFEKLNATCSESLAESLENLFLALRFALYEVAEQNDSIAGKLWLADVISANCELDNAGEFVKKVSAQLAFGDKQIHCIEWVFPLAMADFKKSLELNI